MAEFDNPWKQVAEDFFPELVAFFLPDAYLDIDWRKPAMSLDKDLPKEESEDVVGDRRADKLFQVTTLAGDPLIVFVHIEFQNEVDHDLPERMYIYNYRIYNKHRVPVVSLAILGDTNPDWRPDRYETECWGCTLCFRFRMFKLMDLLAAREQLEAHDNAFGLIILAHLAAKMTRNRQEQRFEEKLAVAKVLLGKKCDLKRFYGIIRFIDRVIDLPPELEPQFHKALKESQGEEAVTYITSFERVAKEEGRAEGQSDWLLHLLREKYGALPGWVIEKVDAGNSRQLDQWFKQALHAQALEQVFGA